MSAPRSDVLVVGAGLSGLAVAYALARAGVDYRLIEARPRVGGRVLSVEAGGGRFDLGPAWIWPHNRRLLSLADRLGLKLHPQHAAGRLVFQDQAGVVRRDLDFATMGGALRVAGGLAGLAEGLTGKLAPDHVHLGTRVTSVSFGPDGVAAGVQGPDGADRFLADRIVLALPPRLISERIAFGPALPTPMARVFRATPTWMAGHAKLVAVYGRAFWRDAGLSGDAVSHRGPLMELHDATDEATRTPALFGFIMPGAARQPGFEAAALVQLAELYGPEAGTPEHVLIRDWSAEPETATEADSTPPAGHPAYGFPQGVTRAIVEWSGGRAVFAGTESADDEGGFLEGALAAAETAVARLERPVPVSHPVP